MSWVVWQGGMIPFLYALIYIEKSLKDTLQNIEGDLSLSLHIVCIFKNNEYTLQLQSERKESCVCF